MEIYLFQIMSLEIVTNFDWEDLKKSFTQKIKNLISVKAKWNNLFINIIQIQLRLKKYLQKISP